MFIMADPPDGGQPDQSPDWRQSSVGDPAPCVVCRRPALMRHPETGRPQHKVCSEPAAPAATVEKAVILPCRFCAQPASLTGPEGKPEHWTCRRKAGDR